MTQELIEMLQDAWFLLRDVSEAHNSPELVRIMGMLHDLVDTELEKQEEKAA